MRNEMKSILKSGKFEVSGTWRLWRNQDGVQPASSLEREIADLSPISMSSF